MPDRPHHTDKWQRCVSDVGGKGGKDPYAICTAQLGPSIEAMDYQCADCGTSMKFAGESRCSMCGSPVNVKGIRHDHENIVNPAGVTRHD